KWDRHIQHDLNHARKDRAWAVAWVLRAFAVLVSPAADFVKVLRSERIYGASVRVKALAVLIAVRAYRAWKMIAVLASGEGVIWNRTEAVRLSDPNKRDSK